MENIKVISNQLNFINSAIDNIVWHIETNTRVLGAEEVLMRVHDGLKNLQKEVRTISKNANDELDKQDMLLKTLNMSNEEIVNALSKMSDKDLDKIIYQGLDESQKLIDDMEE